MESYITIKANNTEMCRFFNKDKLCSVRELKPNNDGTYQALIRYLELSKPLRGIFTIPELKSVIEKESPCNKLCGDCRHIILENWRWGCANCDKYNIIVFADITKPANEYERCPACKAANEPIETSGKKKDRTQYMFKAGFTLKQLYEYIENWNGLIWENQHLKENGAIKAERQKVLEDACYCISVLLAANDEINSRVEKRTALKSIHENRNQEE